MFIKLLQGEAAADDGVQDLADGVFPEAALRHLTADLILKEPGMGHFSLNDISGEITHNRHSHFQAVIDLCEGMEITADHFSAGLQQGIHDPHKLIDVMEVMEDPAFHKYYVKGTAILLQVNLQDITHYIMETNMRGFRRFHGVLPVLLGDIENCHICPKQCQGDGLLSAGAADIGDPDAFITVEVARVLPQHLFGGGHIFLCPFSRGSGVRDPEIIGVVLPGFLVLLAVLFHSSAPL